MLAIFKIYYTNTTIHQSSCIWQKNIVFAVFDLKELRKYRCKNAQQFSVFFLAWKEKEKLEKRLKISWDGAMEEALWGRKAEKSKPTLWKPPLQDRNLATLEFLGSWYAIRRSLQKNKSSPGGIPPDES